jgi:hypothetical protein
MNPIRRKYRDIKITIEAALIVLIMYKDPVNGLKIMMEWLKQGIRDSDKV